MSGEITTVIVGSDNDVNLEDDAIHTCNLNDFFANNLTVELEKISVLQLENCDITSLPLSCRNLNLRKLLLARNQLKEVPSCLYSGLKTLEFLDLSHNSIKSFDVEPACSCSIVTLKLHNNKIYNLPHWILTLRCPRLEELSYSSNFVVDLKSLHELNFKKVEMCNNQLLDVDFKFFKSLRSLEWLDLGNDKSGRGENSFTNYRELFIRAKWSKLKVLRMNNLTISILPEELFRIISLTELCLVNCDLSWIPDDVQYLTKLQILDISNNSVCALSSFVTNLKKLKVIKAAHNNISSIGHFVSNLELLDLYHNYLEELPTSLDNIPLLDLEYNCFDTLNQLSYEVYESKREKLRNLTKCSRINGPRMLQEEEIVSEGNEAESTTSESSKWYYEDGDIEFECWDEDKPNVLIEKHPDVTPSDEEWDGENVVFSNKRESLKKSFIDIDEEWIFCDVD